MSANGEDEDWTPPKGPAAKAALATAIAKSEAAYEAVSSLFDVAHGARKAALAAANEAQACTVAVGKLTAEVSRIAMRSSLPPPRAVLDSKLDLREVASTVMRAALEGERRPDTTPDEQVERVIERIENIRMGRRVRALAGKAVAAAALGGLGWLGHMLLDYIMRGHP